MKSAASSSANPPAVEPVVPAVAPAPTAITQEMLNAAVEAARTEERTRLATELETLRTANATLTSDAQKSATELTTLQDTIATLQSAVKGDGKIDVQKLINEVSERVAKTASNASAQKVTELETRLSAVTEKLKTKEMKELRDKLIADAGGLDALIPELVQGNTEEELTASVARSKSIFDQTKARINPIPAVPPVAGTEPVKPAVVVTPVAPAPGAPAAPVVVAPVGSQVPPAPAAPAELSPTNMRPLTSRTDPVVWKQQRADAMRSLEGRYAGPGAT